MVYYRLTNVGEGNIECPYSSTFKTQAGPVAKMQRWPSGWESNPLPHESSAMLCQLSYGGRSCIFATGPGIIINSHHPLTFMRNLKL